MQISIKGKPVEVRCLEVENRNVVIQGRVIRIARFFDDFLDPIGVDDPEITIQRLKKSKKADIFTFLGKFSDAIDGKYDLTWKDLYHVEYEVEAIIKVDSFDHWWKNDIKKQTRRKVKKARELGIYVTKVPLNDFLINGISRIFNETPVRQGKKFWHYGKKFDQIKREISTYYDRSIFLGAYWKNELIGFAKLINCVDFGRANQILSLIAHRDKPVNNALIAELVRICEKNRIPYLKYGDWIDNSLGDFKRSNGFKPVLIPRYYQNINFRGKIFLASGIYKGYRNILPEGIRRFGIRLRRSWYNYNVI